MKTEKNILIAFLLNFAFDYNIKFINCQLLFAKIQKFCKKIQSNEDRRTENRPGTPIFAFFIQWNTRFLYAGRRMISARKRRTVSATALQA